MRDAMLNFPDFPDTLATRQLQCICCNEVFTIAEDYPTVTGSRTPHWRLVPDRFPDTQLRYQPIRDRRTVTPPMRANPDRNPAEFLDWGRSSKTLVNCPRCGADNRNWLHILRSPQRWSRRFRPALVGYLAPAILCALAVYRFRDLAPGISNLILLLVAIFLAAHIPIQSSTRGWPRLRQYHFAQQYVETQSVWQSLPPPLRTGIISTTSFLFLIPFLLYVLIPWGFDTAVTILTTNNQQDMALQIDAFIATLDTLPDVLQQENNESVQAIVTELEGFVQSMNQNNASGELPTWLSVSELFLRTWVTYVLASAIVGIALGWMAAANFERRIRPHLPRPLYSSVANMTRVVVWEAKRALEIGDEVQQMQWTAVQRNTRGGIDLQGLYRDNRHPTQPVNPMGTKVLAQRYEIASDRWGHIIKAEIKAVRVWPRPRREEALEDEFFSAVPQRPVKRARP